MLAEPEQNCFQWLAAASCDWERLWAFWRGGMCEKTDSDSILQWVCHGETF